ncbi:excinuclease ABC subunit UvrA [Gemmata sp. JC673]|uniref:UvrABC system protein A n=1 Tax=Gemmata algarum TaxID=2975278 RepID=A0ABU5EYM5_9BACT|nr:excinuclease ABC subunit UvrA [Gemmata algarum]MDY3559560.1 excinuclease ABC subunit UvrA [Gemmata algarum]
MQDSKSIVVRGAREHNLRGVDLELPRNKLIVFTGVSGSGKSSLAFDTIYAEGQRRYVESLSSYARQFLGQLPKPDVDYIGGLSPSVSIQQKTAGRNPRSTVGTITEVSDFLRVLYARLGQGHCPKCQRPITAQTREQIIGRILALPEGTRFQLLAPVVRGQKGEFKDFFADMVKRGYVRARVDGQVVKLTDDLKLDKRIKHTIEIVVDRLKADARNRVRVAEAVEQALGLAEGNLIIAVEPEAAPREEEDAEEAAGDVPHARGADILLSAHYACTHCNISYEPPTPQLFSFNNPHGMCPACDGLGTQYTFAPELLVPDPSLSLYQGAIPLVGALKGMGRWRKHIYDGVAKSLGVDLKTPWNKLSAEHQDQLLNGSGDAHIVWEWKQRGGKVWKHGGKWEGIVPQLVAQFKKTAAGPRRAQLEKYMSRVHCPACDGQRLNPQARAVRVGGKTLVEVGRTPIGDLVPWFNEYEKNIPPVSKVVAGELLKEIRARLGFLLNVGLHYLTLDRSAPTLSGGEAQRIRLASQIGSGLVGVLYVLDEPSIGLHPRDNARLLASIERLRDMGNTVLVVEHDEDTMRAADYLVDFGPGPGVRGGEVVAAGTPAEVFAEPRSLTAQYLTGKKQIAIPEKRREPSGKVLRIVGATHNNLKDVTAEVPLGLFVCITGVSGSGKSSLINDVLRTGLSSALTGSGDAEEETEEEAGEVVERAARGRIEGAEQLDKVIDIDQTPIGRTPRSNPATYIKLWDEIRALYAEMSDAKVRGYTPSRFSFNRPGGRCEACEGNGANKLEMDFLADVWVQCPVCEGRRFNRETLQVKYRGKTIQDVLEMEVAEALAHFEHVPKVHQMVKTLHDVGLDYIKLGQPSPTLSGGEAQRIKLAKELVRRSTGKTLYILDEPTTGLHFEDVRKLLEVLHGFADQGNTVLVIEHDLDVVKTADWVIDMGPEGGSGGGRVVVAGTPEQVAKHKGSFTGQALAPILTPNARRTATARSAARGQLKKAKAEQPEPAQFITHLCVEGACQHNLKNVSAKLPREKMSVFCGPSGSGKSSLALDTIYAEGQRRYVESLSSYARQFLGQVQKPRVEQVTGLSPAISIEQKTTSKSPRSTVGTVTEIYDYLRILYARLGQRHCPSCARPVGTQTADEIVDKVLSLPEGTKLYIMAPLERKGQEKYDGLFEEIRRAGFTRMRVNGKSYTIDEPPQIDHRRKHNVEVVVDRNVVKPGTRTRIAEAVEQSLDLGRGVMHIAYVEADTDETKWRVEKYSQHLACEHCNLSFEHLNPHNYSFNSPLGWCPTCEGLGFQRGANANLLLGDTRLSLRGGAVTAWPDLGTGSPWLPFAEALAKHVGFSLDTPFAKLDPAHQRAVLHGTGDDWIAFEASGGRKPPEATKAKAASRAKHSEAPPLAKFQYKGLFPAVDEASRVSWVYRQRLDHLVDEVPCSACRGARIRADAAATRFANLTIGEMCAKPLGDTLALFDSLTLSKTDRKVAGEVLREVSSRLKFMVDVGLDYLTLGRQGPTLSGGEAQRIRLASQIGSGLTGVLYVLDEPTIGLHPRDNEQLLQALHRLRDLGNTLVVVEHDREVIAAADHLLDFGPGAGDHGGEITASGAPKQVAKAAESLTGKYLSGKLAIPVPTNRRTAGEGNPPPSPLPARRGSKGTSESSRESGALGAVVDLLPSLQGGVGGGSETVAARSPHGVTLSILGARQHNLQNVDVHIPLGALVAVTGVSGSGKSSLVNEVLYNTLARKLHRARTAGAAHDDIVGLEHIDKIINVDQDPIGNSPSSNPATYTGVFDLIRELFARLPESKVRGYHPRRFSFNQKGGRCEACEGMGQKVIEMHFLPDVWVECDTCNGTRYNPETLAVRYHGKSIADVLAMRVSEALALFHNIPKIRVVLQTLEDVGLGYMSLGQSAPTMSGGEAQRVKLAAELARPSTGKTLYLLDEPTTGLHFDDVRKLLEVLQRLVDLGNTVITVEHNVDVIKSADWVIDMGPEAGGGGGRVVAAGTPEEVVAQFAAGAPTHTGRILKDVIAAGPFAARPKFDPRAALAERAGDLDIADVGKEQKLPWEADGPGWHTRDRVTTTGKPVKWEGAALSWVIDLIHESGTFPETKWNHRSVVEIPAPRKADGWFLHAMTGHEAYMKLVFPLPGRPFKQDQLAAKLAIPPLSDTPGLEGYSRDANRVEVQNTTGWQTVTITVHKKAEIDTPAFREFLKKAVELVQGLNESGAGGIEANMPWKKDGEKWHLGDKGFPPGRGAKWDRAVLPKLLDLLRELDPALEFKWDTRDAVTVRPAGASRFWARLKTKETDALEVWFTGRRGVAKPAQFDGVGREALVEGDRADGSEVLKVWFATANQFAPAKLKPLLKQHLKAFKAAFGDTENEKEAG